MKIDAHQHFWTYDAAEYPWIPAGSALHRDWLPEDLAPLLEAEGIGGSVCVQARQTLEETRWLLKLAERSPLIRGVVGWVDLRSADVTKQLEEFAGHPKFVAVRHVVQDEPDDEFLLQAEFVRGVGVLQKFDLAYDLLIYPRQLPAAIQLARLFDEQRFVLDHIAKPSIRSGELEPWRTQIRELAQLPNVMCKVSGMVTEADHIHWEPENFTPYLNVVGEAFGEDRLMFGSDWPVCLLAAEYGEVCSIAREWAGHFSTHVQAKMFGDNAAAFYKLP